MNFKQILDAAQGISTVGVLLAIVWAALTKKVVSGWLYMDMKERAEKAEARYFELVQAMHPPVTPKP
jgi:hypothetical protein